MPFPGQRRIQGDYTQHLPNVGAISSNGWIKNPEAKPKLGWKGTESKGISKTPRVVHTPVKRLREEEGRNSGKRRKKKDKEKGNVSILRKWRRRRKGTRVPAGKEEWRSGHWYHGEATVGVRWPLWRELDLGRVKSHGKLWLVNLSLKTHFASERSCNFRHASVTEWFLLYFGFRRFLSQQDISCQGISLLHLERRTGAACFLHTLTLQDLEQQRQMNREFCEKDEKENKWIDLSTPQGWTFPKTWRPRYTDQGHILDVQRLQ